MEVVLQQQYAQPVANSQIIDATCRDLAKSAYKAITAPPLDAEAVKDWKSSTNLYIRGLPDRCTDDLLVQWASVVAEPLSVKAIRAQGAPELCSGVGFVRFEHPAHAATFLEMVNATAGFEAGYAKETYAGKMHRAGDNQSANLYLSHVPTSYTEEDVASIFPPERYNIQSIRLLNEGDRPQHRAVGTKFRGAGFVRLANREEAEAAVAELNGKMLPGHQRLKNGYFETLQIRFADSEAQKLVKASAKAKQGAVREGPTTPTAARFSRKATSPVYLPQTPTKSLTSPVQSPPLPDHLLRHVSSPSNASTISSSSSASSSPLLSILSPSQLNQVPWAMSASSASSSPTTPFDSPLQPKVASNYSFPSYVSHQPFQSSYTSAPRPQTMFPPIEPSFQYRNQAPTRPMPPVPPSHPPQGFVPNMPVLDDLQVPAAVPDLPGSADPVLASLLAAAFQQGQISARMQALSADIAQQQQSLHMQLGPGRYPEPMPSSMPKQPASLQQQLPMSMDAGREWPPHLTPDHLGIPLPQSNLQRSQLPAGGQDYWQDRQSLEAAGRVPHEMPAASPGGLGISGLDMPASIAGRPSFPCSPAPISHTRPRANTEASSHAQGYSTGADNSSLLAPESALARRSSAIENRLMLNEGRGEVNQSKPSLPAAAPLAARLQSRPSVTFADIEEKPMTSPEKPYTSGKTILPFSKTLRSFSAFGLEGHGAGLGDSGYGGPSAGKTSGEDDASAGKYIIPSRRSSHIGLVSPPSAFPLNTRKPSLARTSSRSSLHKTLRESFSNMSLRNGSTQEEVYEEYEGPDDEIQEEELTQISPTYTFGTSYASSQATSDSSPYKQPIGPRYTASMANLEVPDSIFGRKGSDASSGSQDVTDQYAQQVEVIQGQEGKGVAMTESERFLRSLLGRKGSLPIGL